MGAAESSALDESADIIELCFMRAGRTRRFRKGERLINEGQRVTSMFLITVGEVILKKQSKSGTKTIGDRVPGALLGELSFLLDQPASVSVEAAGKVEVLEMAQAALINLLQSDPKLSGGFFRLLGVTLGERITEISGIVRRAVVHTAHATRAHDGAAAVAILPASLDRPAAEVAREFALAEQTEMVLHCDVSMSVEEKLRLRRPGAQRQAIPLRDPPLL